MNAGYSLKLLFSNAWRPLADFKTAFGCAWRSKLAKPFYQTGVQSRLDIKRRILGQHPLEGFGQGTQGVEGQDVIGDDQTAVAAGCPLAEALFIDDGNRPSFFQQVISCKPADNATADDDDMLGFFSSSLYFFIYTNPISVKGFFSRIRRGENRDRSKTGSLPRITSDR